MDQFMLMIAQIRKENVKLDQYQFTHKQRISINGHILILALNKLKCKPKLQLAVITFQAKEAQGTVKDYLVCRFSKEVTSTRTHA